MATTWKTVIQGTGPSAQEVVNVFYHDSNDTDANTMVTLLRWASDWNTAWAATASPEWEATEVRLYKWAGTYWDLQHTEGINVTGAGATSSIPPQNAGVLVAKTAHKRTMGRKFVGGMTVNDILNGAMTTTYLAHLVVLLGLWVTDYANGGQPIYPRVWRKVAHIAEPIIGALIDNLVGSQRRRKADVGR